MNLNKKKLTLGTTAAALVGLAGSADAHLIATFPDGTIPVSTLDWSVGNVLAQRATRAVTNFINGGNPNLNNFNVFFHASLGGTEDNLGNNNTPVGLNRTYEITLVAGFSERVIGVTPLGGTALTTLETLPNNAPLVSPSTGLAVAPSFVEIWFDDLTDNVGQPAVARDGSGYNDGERVFFAEVMGSPFGGTATGFFQTTSTQAPLDGSPNGNQYGSRRSVVGTGTNGAIVVDPDTIETSGVFSNQVLSLEFSNLSQQAPFTSVDPSDCFTNRPLATGISCFPDLPAPPSNSARFQAEGLRGAIPSIGSVNGLVAAQGATGVDFLFQTDANSIVVGVVPQLPEPYPWALLGVGLAALAVGRKRRPAVT